MSPRSHSLLLLSLFLAAGCDGMLTSKPAEETAPSDNNAMANNAMANNAMTNASSPDMSSPNMSSPDMSSPNNSAPNATTGNTGNTTPPDLSYLFRTDGFDTYARVDRIGMPAVATVLIESKAAYNMANPAQDAQGMFVGELVAQLGVLHGKLDDDLAGLSPALTPCTPQRGGTCLMQGAPLIAPDTLKLDTKKGAGFPNGRRLTDPVIDLTLAVILLDLSEHDVDTFAKMPLNPPRNDLGAEGSFPTSFPYLHAPHMP